MRDVQNQESRHQDPIRSQVARVGDEHNHQEKERRRQARRDMLYEAPHKKLIEGIGSLGLDKLQFLVGNMLRF